MISFHKNNNKNGSFMSKEYYFLKEEIVLRRSRIGESRKKCKSTL